MFTPTLSRAPPVPPPNPPYKLLALILQAFTVDEAFQRKIK
jgi:hypothetical protein